jgi:hypothetical protein
MKGAATLIQGYAARLGFGITLKRNQSVDKIPVMTNIKRGGI